MRNVRVSRKLRSHRAGKNFLTIPTRRSYFARVECCPRRARNPAEYRQHRAIVPRGVCPAAPGRSAGFLAGRKSPPSCGHGLLGSVRHPPLGIVGGTPGQRPVGTVLFSHHKIPRRLLACGVSRGRLSGFRSRKSGPSRDIAGRAQRILPDDSDGIRSSQFESRDCGRNRAFRGSPAVGKPASLVSTASCRYPPGRWSRD